MSRHSASKLRQATYGAIAADRLDALLSPTSPGMVDSAAERRKLEEQFRQNNITRVAEASKLNLGSAEILLDNPWLQQHIDKVRKAGAEVGARVTEIRDYGVIALTIKTPKDKHDVAKFEVTRQGKAVIKKQPRGNILMQVIAAALPETRDPQRISRREERSDFGL